jgi:RNA polymerase sigma-70 factor (ECF subfamily)
VVIPFLPRGRSRSPRSDSRSAQDVFAELVRPHLQALYRLAYRFTGRQHEAEDLLQELLTRLYTRPERLNGIESLRPWLARALYNLYIDEHRRLRRSPLGHLHSTAAGGTAEEDAFPVRSDKNTDLNFSTEMAQMRQHLIELVQQLPQEQREVVILHDVEGYELQEAAEILGVALGTVKSRLHRGHERLRGWLRQRNLSPATVVLSTEGPAVEPESPVARVSSDEMY